MSKDTLMGLPYLVAMLGLVVILLSLKRHPSRVPFGGWILTAILILASQLSRYVTWYGTPSYVIAHTFRLCVDLLAGLSLIFSTRSYFGNKAMRVIVILGVTIPLLCLEGLYGIDLVRAKPYIACAIAAVAFSLWLCLRIRCDWKIPFSQAVLWTMVVIFALQHNFRAAAYFGLGGAYAGAAISLWLHLREKSVGRAVVCSGLGVWSFCFFAHPWVMSLPSLFALSNTVWYLQEFLVTIGMVIVILEESVRENEHLALHDQLTGLPNRRLIDIRLRDAIDAGEAIVFLLDLDGFKNINDSFGHQAGDHLLRQVSSQLSSLVRSDETVARLGGDEFLVLSTERSPEFATVIASAVSKPVVLQNGVTVAVRSSIGVSLYPQDAEHLKGREAAARLVEVADQRMYLAKHRG